MRYQLFLWVILLGSAAITSGQTSPFNQAEVVQFYNHWTNYDTDRTTYDVVHLRGGRSDGDEFCSQMSSNASVVPGTLGKRNIYTYCDPQLGDLSIGDGCCLDYWKRRGTYAQGDIYDLTPLCEPDLFPYCPAPLPGQDPDVMDYLLHFQPVEKPGGGHYVWTSVGWMGQRMAVFYSPGGDAGDHHYFALIHLADMGNPNNQPDPQWHDDRFFLSWAVSRDGARWAFEKKNADLSNCSIESNYLDADPKLAQPILYRECFQSDLTPEKFGFEVFHHYALFYSDPSQQDIYGNVGDGNIYVLLGYTPSGSGVWNIAVRFPFDPTTCTGRGRPEQNNFIQIYRDDGVSGDGPYCPSQGQWIDLDACSNNCAGCTRWPGNASNEPGCIPCDVDQSFRSGLYNEFVSGLAVPFDWITLKDKNGNFYGSVVAYSPAHTFGNDRIGIRFTRDIQPPFHWTEERQLNTCAIPALYTTCEAGGLNVALYQPAYSKYPAFYNPDGSPAKIFGYFGHTKHDCCPDTNVDCQLPDGSPDCTIESGGLLPATILLTDVSSFNEVADLHVSRGGGESVILTWTAIPDDWVVGYIVLEGTLTHDEGDTLPPHAIPFTPCWENEAVEVVVDDTIKYLSTVYYDHYRKLCDIVQPPIIEGEPLPTVSVTLTPTESDGRYWLVVPTCHRQDEGSCGYASSGRERLVPVCQCGPNAFNCYHFWDQGYGRWHWPQPKSGGTP